MNVSKVAVIKSRIVNINNIDKKIFNSILKGGKTYWIIIGRCWYDCCSYNGCRGILIRDIDNVNKNKSTVKYGEYS